MMSYVNELQNNAVFILQISHLHHVTWISCRTRSFYILWQFSENWGMENIRIDEYHTVEF